VQYKLSHVREVKQTSIGLLFRNYKDILWDDGRHKYNVSSFIGEIDEILLGMRFSSFDQELLDSLIITLRQRGNSNATINRKMAALSKLLNKAVKMGEIHSLPEFRRQKEGAGRIRFLEPEEEDRLFFAIRTRSEDAYRLCVFLVDTGCRLGEAMGLIWNDIQGSRVSFWLTKSGRSRSVPLTRRACEVVQKLPLEPGQRRPKGLSPRSRSRNSARSGIRQRPRSAWETTTRWFRMCCATLARHDWFKAVSICAAYRCGWVTRPCR